MLRRDDLLHLGVILWVHEYGILRYYRKLCPIRGEEQRILEVCCDAVVCAQCPVHPGRAGYTLWGNATRVAFNHERSRSMEPGKASIRRNVAEQHEAARQR